MMLKSLNLVLKCFFYLFYLQDDFIALEIVDKKVRFVWNVGGGTGILVHPEVIENGDLRNDTSWYRIEAERYYIF